MNVVNAYQAVALLQALAEAERLSSSGAVVFWCLARAASKHAVAPDEVALAWLEKVIGATRARAAVQAMHECDQSITAQGGIKSQRGERTAR
jgi:hypothetical protein